LAGPLDPAATVEGAAFDAATIHLIGCAVLRETLQHSVTPEEFAGLDTAEITESCDGAAGAEMVLAANPRVGPDKPCSEAFRLVNARLG